MPWRRIATVAGVTFGLDRLTKLWVVEWMDLKNVGRIDIAEPFLTFRMAWNQGVNFGILNLGDDGRWVLIGVSLLIVAVVLFWTRHASGWLVPVAAGLVTGGAIGNIWDRVQYGAVADFLNMSCCGISNPYAFNIADIAIFLGAVLLIFFAENISRSA